MFVACQPSPWVRKFGPQQASSSCPSSQHRASESGTNARRTSKFLQWSTRQQVAEECVQMPLLKILGFNFLPSEESPRVSRFGHCKRRVPLVRSVFRAKCALSLNPTRAPRLTQILASHLVQAARKHDFGVRMTNIRMKSIPNQTEIRGRKRGLSCQKDDPQRRSPIAHELPPFHSESPKYQPNTGADVLKSPRTDRQQVSHSVITHPARSAQNARSLAQRTFGHRILGAGQGNAAPKRPAFAGVTCRKRNGASWTAQRRHRIFGGFNASITCLAGEMLHEPAL